MVEVRGALYSAVRTVSVLFVFVALFAFVVLFALPYSWADIYCRRKTTENETIPHPLGVDDRCAARGNQGVRAKDLAANPGENAGALPVLVSAADMLPTIPSMFHMAIETDTRGSSASENSTGCATEIQDLDSRDGGDARGTMGNGDTDEMEIASSVVPDAEASPAEGRGCRGEGALPTVVAPTRGERRGLSPVFAWSPPTPPQALYPASHSRGALRTVREDAAEAAYEDYSAVTAGCNGREMEALDVVDRSVARPRVSGRAAGDERLAERFGDPLGDRFVGRQDDLYGDRDRGLHEDLSIEDFGEGVRVRRQQAPFGGSGTDFRRPSGSTFMGAGADADAGEDAEGERQQELLSKARWRARSSEYEEDEEDSADMGAGRGNGRVAQIAEGLMWVQKHPVLAAVVWMVGKVIAPASEEHARERETPSGDDDGDVGENRDGAEEGKRKKRPLSSEGAMSQEGCSRVESGSLEGEGILPPSLSRKQSLKGRLSWSDDYGGSLAEYYEDRGERVLSSDEPESNDGANGRSDVGSGGGGCKSDGPGPGPDADADLGEIPGRGGGGEVALRVLCNAKGGNGSRKLMYQDAGDKDQSLGMDTAGPRPGGLTHPTGAISLDGPVASPPENQGRAAGPSSDRSPDDASGFLPRVGQSSMSVIGGTAQHVGTGTWSPQWGWYVSMTPPQDMYPTSQPPVAHARAAPCHGVDNPEMHTTVHGRPPRP